MPLYEYLCEGCNTILEYTCSMTDMPRTLECPECKKECDKYIGNLSCNFAKRGDGWTPNWSATKEDRESYAKRWATEEISNTKEALDYNSGASPYSRMEVDHEYFEKEGIAKKVSSAQAKTNSEAHKKVTQESAKALTKEELRQSTKDHRAYSK